jgi:hypothetical protein
VTLQAQELVHFVAKVQRHEETGEIHVFYFSLYYPLILNVACCLPGALGVNSSHVAVTLEWLDLVHKASPNSSQSLW